MPDLRRHYTDEHLAVMLGVFVFTLGWQRQPAPVARLAYLLHRLTFTPSDPLTTLELICLGRHGTGPQGPVAVPAKVCEKPNDFGDVLDWQI